MSLVPCKYFARNECRFGDNCRFYHARTGAGNVNPVANVFGNRSTNQSYNANVQQQQQDLAAKSHQNMDALVDVVKKDMVEWEHGKIWPFSTYGPVGNKPSVPGFEDISFEELRYRYLQNNKNPPDLTLEQRNLHQNRQNYQQQSAAVRNVLERIILKGERVSDVSSVTPSSGTWGISSTLPTPQTQSIFGGGGVFGGGTSASSLFQGNASSSIFGNTSSPFGAAGSTGSAPTQTIMGGGDGVESMEGSVQQPSQATSLFPQPQQQVNTGIFGGQNKPVSQFGAFGQSSSTGIFGGASQQPNNFQAVLPQQQSSVASVFGQPQQNQSFSQQPSSGMFQTQPSSFQSPQLQSLLQSNNQQQPPQQNLFQTTQPQFMGQTQNQPAPFSFSVPDGNPPTSSASSIFGGGFSQQPTVTTVSTAQSVFGVPQTQPSSQSAATTGPATQSFFGTPPTNIQPTVAPASIPQSIFGAPPNMTSTNPSIFGPQSKTPSIFPLQVGGSVGTVGSSATAPDQKYVYSEESDLAQEEIDAFRAPSFTIENIPIRPPPKSYCV